MALDSLGSWGVGDFWVSGEAEQCRRQNNGAERLAPLFPFLQAFLVRGLKMDQQRLQVVLCWAAEN